MVDILVRGGQVAIPSGVGNWDVGVEGERIVAVTEPGAISPEGTRVIDASGKIVVPGGIEPHAHMRSDISREGYGSTSGVEVVSKAAIYGGTTTILDFAEQGDHPDLQAALEEGSDRWRGNGYTDYSYHPIFAGGASTAAIEQIPEVVQAGFASFKVFTTGRVGLQTLHGGGKSWDRTLPKTDFGTMSAIMRQITAIARSTLL